MERSYLLLTGSLSGLVSILAQAVLWSLAEAAFPRLRTADTSSRQLDVPDILVHMAAGVGLGLLFWLSWGLTAIVDVSWWWRGLIFGGLTWAVLIAPSVISITRAMQLAAVPATVLAMRWATTCVIAGLACAWSWERAV
ncbi:MAG TPA: hypothetical protein VNQ81_04700 [Povalibacter sp.]|nr:hypothetical protein [Povalibacter sp.]